MPAVCLSWHSLAVNNNVYVSFSLESRYCLTIPCIQLVLPYSKEDTELSARSSFYTLASGNKLQTVVRNCRPVHIKLWFTVSTNQEEEFGVALMIGRRLLGAVYGHYEQTWPHMIKDDLADSSVSLLPSCHRVLFLVTSATNQMLRTRNPIRSR